MSDRGTQGGEQPPTPLVDVVWLQDHLDDAEVLPVEVGLDAASYFAGHVPGAVPLAWLDDLHEPDRRGVPSQRRFERLLGRAGVTTDTHVVLYGDEDNTFAAYACWLLRYYGHPRVSLLDGGRRAWVASGAPLVAEVPDRPLSPYRSPGPDARLRATRETLLERCVVAPPGTAVVDCRSAQEFAGHASGVIPLPVLRSRLRGHVPSARHLPHTALLDPATGCFPSPDVLHAQVAGLAQTDDIVVYCDVGERSALNWFVLHELLGYPHVRLYDGGWAEYGSLVGVPVAR